MSIWGVNQAPPAPLIVTAGADVACPAATETNCLGGAITVGSPGFNFAIQSDCTFVVVLGATSPTALVLAVRQGAGADYDTYTVNPASLVASAILQLAPSFVGVFGRNALVGGATINVTVNPTGQAVTFKQGGRVAHTFSASADV